MYDVETEMGISESLEVTDDFIHKQKSANPNKKTATDTNTDTLFSATWKRRLDKWKNWKPTYFRAWQPFIQIYIQI